MSKQRISNSPRVLEYLLNNEIPISDRLAEYNKHVNLAFEKGLYPSFDKLVFDNEIGIEAFKIEKQKAIDTIQNKQRTLDYESFVRYLFYEIGVFDNKRTIHGTETIIYDITPIDKQQAEILERVSIEYAKANAGTYIKEALKIGSKTLLVPFILFDNLKTALQESLGKPFADKQQVIANYKKQHLEPLQDTKNESTAQTIYRNFKAGKTIRNKEQDYLYYTTKGAVMELLEFENYLNQTSEPQQPETVKPDEVYKTQLLFKVGLLFAKGEMNKYFTVNSKGKTVMNNGFTAPKIAKELGNESYNKYILATINNYTPDKENGSKNIFNSFDMMSKIITHCEAENITVDTYFRSRLPIE